MGYSQSSIRSAGIVALILCLPTPIAGQEEAWQTVFGEPGSAEGAGWQSSWIDLSAVTTFAAGDQLRLYILGDANRVLVRLLPRGAPPPSQAGLLPGPIEVSADGFVYITLEQPHADVVQVSVHAGRSAWNIPLNADGSPAVLQNVARRRR